MSCTVSLQLGLVGETTNVNTEGQRLPGGRFRELPLTLCVWTSTRGRGSFPRGVPGPAGAATGRGREGVPAFREHDHVVTLPGGHASPLSPASRPLQELLCRDTPPVRGPAGILD